MDQKFSTVWEKMSENLRGGGFFLTHTVVCHGLDACALTKSELSSLDFTVNRFFMKLFRTGNIEVVKNCQVYFEFSSPSVIWAECVKKFEAKYVTCDETFIHYGHCMD